MNFAQSGNDRLLRYQYPDRLSQWGAEAQVATAPYSRRCISRITWMEVLARVKDTPGEDIARTFLAQFEVIEMTEDVAEAALTIRRHHVPKLKMPDAIILASARLLGCRLITRNTRDFPSDSADVHIPYGR